MEEISRGVAAHVTSVRGDGTLLSHVASIYAKILGYIRSLLSLSVGPAAVLQASKEREQDSPEAVKEKAFQHLAAATKAFDSLCSVASAIDRASKKSTLVIDSTLAAEMEGLANKLETVFNLPYFTEEDLQFQELVKGKIASELSKIVLRELDEKVSQRRIASLEDAKRLIKSRLSSRFEGGLFSDEELSAVLRKTRIKSNDLAELIFHEDKDIRVLLPLIGAVFPKVADFLQSKIEDSIDNETGMTDLAALRLAMIYVSRLRGEIDTCRKSYLRLSRVLHVKQQEYLASGNRGPKVSRLKGRSRATELTGADSGNARKTDTRISDQKAVVVENKTHLHQPRDLYRKKIKASDLVNYIGGNKNEILSKSLKIIDGLSSCMILDEKSKSKLIDDLDAILESVMKLITAQVSVDAPVTEYALMNLIQHDIELSNKHGKGKSAILKKIISSVLVHEEKQLWS